MTNAGERFTEIAARLRQGDQPSPETVRTVLSWFGAQRRSVWIVERIQSALKSAGLETIPDVWSTYLDGQLRFTLRADSADKLTPAPLVDTRAQAQTVTVIPADPTYRLARLPSANVTPLSVHPDDSLELAIGHMIKKDFSQLPIMEGERTLKGIISWASIAKRQGLGVPVSKVRDCIARLETARQAVREVTPILTSALENFSRYVPPEPLPLLRTYFQCGREVKE